MLGTSWSSVPALLGAILAGGTFGAAAAPALQKGCTARCSRVSSCIKLEVCPCLINLFSCWWTIIPTSSNIYYGWLFDQPIITVVVAKLNFGRPSLFQPFSLNRLPSTIFDYDQQPLSFDAPVGWMLSKGKPIIQHFSRWTSQQWLFPNGDVRHVACWPTATLSEGNHLGSFRFLPMIMQYHALKQTSFNSLFKQVQFVCLTVTKLVTICVRSCPCVNSSDLGEFAAGIAYDCPIHVALKNSSWKNVYAKYMQPHEPHLTTINIYQL